MFFRKKKDKAVRKIDKLVTGFIIGGAVAGMIGLTQTKKGKEVTGEIKQKSKTIFQKSKLAFGVTALKILKLFNKNK